ncbi:hypothetical protein PLESTF_001940700 [Pleodorina starrii]|nr:hypothetical protein PLESTF_001940700 [Pleodorina starrii]
MWRGPRTLSLGRDLGRICRRTSSALCWRERNWDQYRTPRHWLLSLVADPGGAGRGGAGRGELSELFQWRPEAEAGPGLPGFSGSGWRWMRSWLACCCTCNASAAATASLKTAAAAPAATATAANEAAATLAAAVGAAAATPLPPYPPPPYDGSGVCLGRWHASKTLLQRTASGRRSDGPLG